MGILKTIAKGICAAVTIFAILGLLFLCYEPFDGETIKYAKPEIVLTPKIVSTPKPNTTPEPVESSIEDFINVYKSGQDITVECKRLSVSGNNNDIQIANSDVEKITILGYGNSVGYSCDANPKIVDHGDYNDVWQRWLT